MRSRRLFLVPLLSPLLAILLVAALNPRPQVSIRILTWVTPRAPFGAWLATAALGGAALSAVGTTLALRRGGALPGRRRTVHQAPEPGTRGGTPDRGWQGMDEARVPETWRVGRPASDDTDRPSADRSAGGWGDAHAVVAPPRAPGDPAPTLDATFRVLRRGPTASGEASIPARGEAIVVDTQQDWGNQSAEDW